MNNGIGHLEDRDLKRPTGLVYDTKTLYVNGGHTIRTYDAETGEFIEVWVHEMQKDGMDANFLVFHST